jgi:hypothetical protein
VTKIRHTTNSAFTISQTSNHPIIPTVKPPFTFYDGSTLF